MASCGCVFVFTSITASSSSSSSSSLLLMIGIGISIGCCCCCARDGVTTEVKAAQGRQARHVRKAREVVIRKVKICEPGVARRAPAGSRRCTEGEDGLEVTGRVEELEAGEAKQQRPHVHDAVAAAVESDEGVRVAVFAQRWDVSAASRTVEPRCRL